MIQLLAFLAVTTATPITAFVAPTHQHQQQRLRIETSTTTNLNLLPDPTPVLHDLTSNLLAANAALPVPDATATVSDAAMTTTSTTTASSFIDQLETLAKAGGLPALALVVTLTDSIPLVPTQPVSILAGAVLGFPGGLLAVTLGQALATLWALSIGRKLGPSMLRTLGDETSEKIQKVLQQLGLDAKANSLQVFTTILVARQSPVLPFSVGNYAVGAATSAPILPALLGTVLGCVPLNCVWVGAGAGGMTALDMVVNGNAGAEASPYMGALETVGAMATILSVASVIKAVWTVLKEDDEKAGTNEMAASVETTRTL